MSTFYRGTHSNGAEFDSRKVGEGAKKFSDWSANGANDDNITHGERPHEHLRETRRVNEAEYTSAM